MGKFCLYSDSCEKAPCLSIRLRKYSYLKDFIDNKSKPIERAYSVPLLIECLRLVDGQLLIQELKCINCMFCIFGCVGNRVLITKEIHPTQLCVDITNEQIQELKNEFLPKLFRGNFLKLPKVPLSQIRAKYRNFDSFTSVDETRNIAVWGANAMKYLSSSLEPRISLEVGLLISERDRGGRLDISLLNSIDNYLFVAETKISFEAMMSEQRYESQLLAYESEMHKVCPKSLNHCKFLLVGGEESDLLPFSNDFCSGGNNSKLFYDVLRKRKFFFISANAMLALGLLKLFVSQETYALENLFKIITSDEYVGLLSSGVVTKDENIIPFEEIPNFII